MYDIDGIGCVRPDEAIEILRGEFEGLPDDCIRAIVFRFDKGNNRHVDFVEFLEFYAFIKAK